MIPAPTDAEISNALRILGVVGGMIATANDDDPAECQRIIRLMRSFIEGEAQACPVLH
jgi:hypothetical protein